MGPGSNRSQVAAAYEGAAAPEWVPRPSIVDQALAARVRSPRAGSRTGSIA